VGLFFDFCYLPQAVASWPWEEAAAHIEGGYSSGWQDEHGFTGGITIVKDYIALVGSVEVEIVSIPPVPDHRH
jgi:hypothetical protein